MARIDGRQPDMLRPFRMERGFQRLIAGGYKSERLTKINADLRASIRAGRGRANSARENLLTQAVKKYLPQILNERFKKDALLLTDRFQRCDCL